VTSLIEGSEMNENVQSVTSALSERSRMTKEEFIQTLSERNWVEFGKGRISSPDSVISEAIAKDLSKILPASAEIYYAIELSHLAESLTGNLVWLLLLRNQLLQITATMVKAGPKKDELLQITHRFYPMERLDRAEIQVHHTEGSGERGRIELPYSASAVLVFVGGERIEIPRRVGPSGVEALREFMGSLSP